MDTKEIVLLVTGSTAWNAGNYCEAYSGIRLASEALAVEGNTFACRIYNMLQMDRELLSRDAALYGKARRIWEASFVVGFYASYELHEIPAEDRELYAESTQIIVKEKRINTR